jgi:Sugar-transfer associated ATP-grasp
VKLAKPVKRVSQRLITARDFYRFLAGPGREVQRRHGVSRVQQIAQFLHYRNTLGAWSSEYYMFELYRPDMSDTSRQRFLMQNAWNALSRVVNQPNRQTDDSKLELSRHFAEAGIPAPRTFGYTSFSAAARHRAEPEFIPLSELARIVPANGFVLKRDWSTWGLGVLVFKSFDGHIYQHVDGRRFDTHGLGELLHKQERLGDLKRKQGGGFLVQERLDNHPDIAALGITGLATLRVVTYGTGDDIRIPRAALKLPVGTTGLDNYHAGGIAAPVDVESGRVGAGAGRLGLEWLSSHPETRKRFEGMFVPLWDEVLRQTRRAAMSMPDFRSVGWDVAVTPDGVRIVEANSRWGTAVVQRPHRTGIWDGDFRQWCLATLGNAELPVATRRWLGLLESR